MRSRRAEVAAALAAANGAFVSGESIARRIGVSRTAVAKQVQGLRECGYRVESANRRGYRLVALPEETVPPEVERLVTDPFWNRFDGGVVTASTNDDCKRLARDGAPEGAVVVAAEQTAGRGRLGRQWISPRGGAYFSALLRPPVAPADAPPLALVCSLGIAAALEAAGAPVMLKWPNDVYLGWRKLGGVLLEMAAEADRVQWVVAGCGINVRRTPELAPEAASLDEVAPMRPAEVAAIALDGIAQAYREFVRAGFAGLVEQYERRHLLPGREVTVRDLAGGTVAHGEAMGVDGMGRLLVRTAEGPVPVVAGEVTLAPTGGER
ncbi:biotin--[acetyl-CoA-carboxylase] ligase [Coriobacteriia bacterium Es71-Z0120]|uniref:biotin--[acetyl-CoA-carboxylase] ligase n=1 Tax=Parvivirga hydrogeniphila TaxID=2939460 RepID=UPI002260AF08|nr:biotin--[acetyl-CoA-carboxylase] ligase [Parvivirga hydrogeniphila]MCL4079399.1 biotin--[acetyl-CoA-carboxylase] ligase [Parvivirga hydrogeniphila]